jgi:hypothetical protein
MNAVQRMYVHDMERAVYSVFTDLVHYITWKQRLQRRNTQLRSSTIEDFRAPSGVSYDFSCCFGVEMFMGFTGSGEQRGVSRMVLCIVSHL